MESPRHVMLRVLVLLYSVGEFHSVASQATSPSSLTLNSRVEANMEQTLLSPGGVFRMGFYQKSVHYTLAIWYAQITSVQTVVWMADRSMYLTRNASLYLSPDGDLQVYDGSPTPRLMWTSNTSQMNVTRATILDTGNFVLLNEANGVVWQSFDSPTDTLLPTQVYAIDHNITMYSMQRNDQFWSKGNYTLGWGGYRTNNDSYEAPPSGLSLLSLSWQSPSNRNLWFNYSTDVLAYWNSKNDYSSIVLTNDGEVQGINRSNMVEVVAKNLNDFQMVGRLRRMTIDVDGNWRMYSWFVGSSTQWSVVWEATSSICSIFGFCGPYGICDTGQCYCPQGFQFIDDGDKRKGCERVNVLASCSNTSMHPDTLAKITGIDYPYGGDFVFLSDITLGACLNSCLAHCLCEAVLYDGVELTGYTSTCIMKKSTLINGRVSSVKTTYIRIGYQPPRMSLWSIFITVISTLGPLVIIFGIMSCILSCLILQKRIKIFQLKKIKKKMDFVHGTIVRFSYQEIRLITKNFTKEIGKGGFGTVFKGNISHCKGKKQFVAVKRLDKLENGGKESKNFADEVDTIGRIHHVHLVHLVGYCAERNHRIFVYEYMENLSLDRILFQNDDHKVHILEWRSRFNIAIETAKGLAYLHEGIRDQCIIHCDVKPENILLDSTFSAKVADFGMSRIIDRGKTHTMTTSIRGTMGYVAPEWISNSMPITTKVDVYSYGMVLLEIISGRRNLKASLLDKPNDEIDPKWYFPIWAYSKLKDTTTMLEALDPLLTGIVDINEACRALQVAFWCVNDKPHLRPSMSQVVQMLENHATIGLPIPQPNFLIDNYGNMNDSSFQIQISDSSSSL